MKEALAVEEIKHHLSELEATRSSSVAEDD